MSPETRAERQRRERRERDRNSLTGFLLSWCSDEAKRDFYRHVPLWSFAENSEV